MPMVILTITVSGKDATEGFGRGDAELLGFGGHHGNSSLEVGAAGKPCGE
jgi:hypothetical protein